jgi:hypothetical protein
MRSWINPEWTFVLAVVVAGCGPSTAAVPTPSTTDFGRFEGDVVALWDADGRHMTLREDFAYIDSRGQRWLAPAGTVVDGASIPRLFWTVIGSPFAGRYRNASVVHDIECDEMRSPWQDVHRMFYEACRCGGVDEAQAKIMYYAVYHFGPRWQSVVENVLEQVAGPDGQLVEQEMTVQHTVRIDPPPPTPAEVEQVLAYIAEEDPDREVLERFTRDSLHRRPSRGRRDTTSHSEPQETAPRIPRDIGSWRDRVDGTPVRPHERSDPQRVAPSIRQPSGPRTEIRVPPVSPETQQWVTGIVRQHVEQQTGVPRPAEYQVERHRGGYRVLIQFLHEDDQGRLVPYEGGTSTARVSRDGQVLEMVSGFASLDRIPGT